MVRTCETYIDEHGNKVVEPVYHAAGGTVAGVICVHK